VNKKTEVSKKENELLSKFFKKENTKEDSQLEVKEDTLEPKVYYEDMPVY
jgi:hypothetical protein